MPWDAAVWTFSLVALIAAISGRCLGARMRIRAAPGVTLSGLAWLAPCLGLFSTVFVLTWISSGWLSMDHGRLF